jgi:hypothetical protein
MVKTKKVLWLRINEQSDLCVFFKVIWWSL